MHISPLFFSKKKEKRLRKQGNDKRVDRVIDNEEQTVQRFLPGRLDSVVRDLHWALERSQFTTEPEGIWSGSGPGWETLLSMAYCLE